ncbi:MAG: OmpH family outer membrane protein [Methylacidiphilales bacterium]|nr:OmpH family outer membrane protein [Candidatus Methylacidiphilales bacterium]
MKKLLLLCLLILAPVSLATADLKVAVIDLGKAFDSFYKTKDAQARIKEKQDQFQKEYEDLVNDYQHMTDEAKTLYQQSQDATMSADARKDKTAALQQKQQDLLNLKNKIQEMQTERTNEIKDELIRRHKEIVDEIAKVINDYSGPQGYDIVIDKSSASAASGVPIVLYNSSKLTDITPDIIKLLNQGAPADATSMAPAAH